VLLRVRVCVHPQGSGLVQLFVHRVLGCAEEIKAANESALQRPLKDLKQNEFYQWNARPCPHADWKRVLPAGPAGSKRPCLHVWLAGELKFICQQLVHEKIKMGAHHV